MANLELVVSFNAWDGTVDTGSIPSAYRIDLRSGDSGSWETLQQIDGEQHGIVEAVTRHLDRSGTYTIQVIPLLVQEGLIYEGSGPQKSFVYSTETIQNGNYIEIFVPNYQQKCYINFVKPIILEAQRWCLP